MAQEIHNCFPTGQINTKEEGIVKLLQKDQVPYWQLQERDLQTLFSSASESCGSAHSHS